MIDSGKGEYMKNEKSKMILNNRPMVAGLNRQNDAYKNNSEKGLNAYTVFLCVVCAIIAVLFLVNKVWLFGGIFAGIGALLAFVAVLSYKAEKKAEMDAQRSNNTEHPDAIFKDHEE